MSAPSKEEILNKQMEKIRENRAKHLVQRRENSEDFEKAKEKEKFG